MMNLNGLLTGGAAALLALTLSVTIEAQENTPAFPKGAPVTIAVASTAGGGYDSYARLVARHLGKYVPGAPSIVVTNMTGAGGNVVARWLSNVAPRDGTTIALVLPGTITGGLYVDKAKLQYDPSRLSHLGSANSEIDMCFVRTDAGVKTLAEARQKEVIVGGSAEGGATREQPSALNNIVGTKFKIVSGYPGTREIMLAIEQNEVQGVCGISYSAMRLQRPQWFETGFILPLSQNHLHGDPALTAKGVMRAIDLARSDEDRQVLELIYSQQVFGRPFVMAERVPPARLALMRKAFLATLADKDLLADAAKLRLDINPVPGEELQALVQKLYASPPHIIKRAGDALKGL
jgi:tripartite-type tricarboxylate transporter receptor subunit TctC